MKPSFQDIYLSALKFCIFGKVNHSHAATAKFFKDFVVGNSLADHNLLSINQ